MPSLPLTRLIVGFFLILFLTVAVRADEYDTLRLKWRDLIVGAGYDIADPDVAARLATVASSANSNWASMDKSLTRTFLWSDLASTTNSGNVSSSYTRLLTMALGYATPGSSLAGNAALLADIVGGLDWMNANRYNPTIAEYNNWWDWEIGSPRPLTDLCVLLYDQLTVTQRTNYMNAVEHFVPTPDMTGANKVWKARAVGVRGCIVKSATKIALCRDAFSTVFPYVTSGDGFYTDGSFIQHNFHPYTTGYGEELISTMAPLLNWLSGSTWDVTDPARANVYRWVFEAYEPVIYRGNTFDSVRGREAGRSSASTSSGTTMDAILQIAQFAPTADAARMKRMIKEWALADTTRSFVAGRGLPTLGMAQAVMNDASILRRGELLAHYTFGGMDRVMHLGAGYGFGLSMCSTRVANFESINSENLRAWFTGDGQTTLYNADLNAFADSYWATIDHYRLPGVTADVTHNKLPSDSFPLGPRAQGQSTLSPHNWAGGATLGQFGAAGMQFKGVGVTLTGKKSWFMFDDEVVCLGAGITSTDSRPIETTVENRKLTSAGANAFTVNGAPKSTALSWTEAMPAVSWAHLAGNVTGSDIGYYFPQAPTVKAVREAHTGTWDDMDGGSSTTPITRNFLRLGFEHGSNPAGATYQYVLLPGRTAARTGHYAAAPQVAVLANNSNVQAVQETTLGITAANFWTDTSQTVGGITANKKASVLVRNDGTFIDVSISDPTQANAGTIALQIALDGGTLISADAGVAVTQVSPTIALTVSTSAASGKTFKARFYIGTPQTVNVSAEADAYVYDATASVNSNFGTATTLIVKKSGTGFNRESFLRFNVPAYSGTLLGAALRLVPLSTSTPGTHGVQTVPDNSWIESGVGGITWNNKPAASATVLASWTPALSVPVNADVLPAIAGGGIYSFRVYGATQTTDGYVTYGARENSTAANRPLLVLSVGRTPPEVAITSPADGDFILRAGALTITADAQSTGSTITSVAFYDGAALLGTATSAPYQITPNLGGGTHLLTAVATDANGLSKTSFVKRIDVAFPPTAAPASAMTPRETSVDIDLRPLVSDVETPAASLRITLGSAANGTVSLLADGVTARFSPALGYSGPASFSYTVTDTTRDARTLLNYSFQNGDATDSSGQGRDGTMNVQGTGVASFAASAPAALAPYTQSLALTENGTAGAVRLQRTLLTTELDLQNADWTIAGWFRRATATNQDSIVQLGSSGGYASNALTLAYYGTSTTLTLRNFNGSSEDVKIEKASVSTAVWHHFAIVRGGATLSLYVDGALVGSDSAFGFGFTNAQPVEFGGVGPTTVLDRWLNGSLADLAVFNAALPATDVTRLANQPTASFGGQTATANVSVNVLFPMDSWRLANFGTMSNTGTAADDADPNHDGIVNKLEFFLARNPLTQNPASSLPAAGRNGAMLEYTYTRSRSAMSQLSYAVEWTDTLATGSWSSAGVTEQILSDNGTVQQIKASVPTGSNSRRFLRLKVQ